MIDFLKEQIAKNKEIKTILKDCDDSFLLENQSIILTALDEENMPEGYKVSIKINGDVVEWEYTPNTKNTEEAKKIYDKSLNYSYKLPIDWKKYYLLDLNDVNWVESKRQLAKECKVILNCIEKNKSPKGLWIWGNSNSGKTYACIALLNMIASHGKKVAFVNISELITKTQSAMSDSNNNYSMYIEQIKKANVVVLDDLGSERPTPWFKENVLIPILDYRLKANKTTIINSNLNIDKYINRLKYRSQNPEIEEVNNTKIEFLIKELVGNKEIKIS